MTTETSPGSQSLFILGRQPALGLAELERLYGAGNLYPAGPIAALLTKPADQVDFARLGGSIKMGHLLATLSTTDWAAVETYLRKNLPALLQDAPEGKLKLGLSLHGYNISVAKLNAAGLTLKKTLRQSPLTSGRSVRLVPNKDLELNSAQVLHNNLAGPTGCEILVVRDSQRTHIARTTNVQDIDAYAARDQGRPKRDARVGMLPPKLAQIIVNLAVGNTAPSHGHVVLDPFCGTGVVLQEAILMGYGAFGSDLEPRMVDFSRKNLEWLAGQHPRQAANGHDVRLEAGDATSHQWSPTPQFVAGETYLGQPFASLPSPEKLEQVRSACNLIHRKFLQNIGRQLPAGSQLCLAVPAWQVKPGQFQHLSTLDHLEELGYNRMSFKHVEVSKGTNDLVYARADQIVARELLVLTKK